MTDEADTIAGSGSLAQLRSIAREVDRAGTSSHRSDGGTAIDAWQAIASGLWTLLDRFDHDGRRYLVALENGPEASKKASLTVRERQVVSACARGHSSKLVAYDLRLAQSTVATHLRSALTKLGVRSRVELITAFGRLGGDATTMARQSPAVTKW